MKEVLIKCDICGKPAKQYKYKTGRVLEASGNSYESEYDYKDWCFQHLVDFVRKNNNHILEAS